jgi:hypothetical protein
MENDTQQAAPVAALTLFSESTRAELVALLVNLASGRLGATLSDVDRNAVTGLAEALCSGEVEQARSALTAGYIVCSLQAHLARASAAAADPEREE